MGLPANKTPWPPKEDSVRYRNMRTASVWYGGNPDHLQDLNGGNGVTQTKTQGGIVKRAVEWTRDTFWSRPTPDGEAGSKLHVDIARDIATISSELLHADPPRIIVEGPREFAEGQDEATEDPTGPFVENVRNIQARLDYILDRINWESLLLAAAETQSPLGSVGLRIGWDEAVASHPFVTRVDADAYLVEYTWGMLTAVTFWRTVQGTVQGDADVFRHLERHERGRVLHGLYKGTSENLGIAVPLNESAATEQFAALVDQDSAIATVENVLTGYSVPNMLPDPLDRLSNVGRSDYSPATYGLMDSLDKVYTSLMRDIDNAQGRLIVADYMLEDQGAGNGVSFDPDRRVYSTLKMAPGEDGDAPITIVQFAIRVEEHIRAAEFLAGKIIKSAGYNPQTLGDNPEDGTAMTATETNSRERRSNTTRDKKIRYWQNVLEDLIWALLMVDKEKFRNGQDALAGFDFTDVRIRVKYPDAVQPDMLVLAQTVAQMKAAEAASIKVRVQTLHRDWDESEVAREVVELQNEASAVNPVTFGMGGDPGAGNGQTPIPGI